MALRCRRSLGWRSSRRSMRAHRRGLPVDCIERKSLFLDLVSNCHLRSRGWAKKGAPKPAIAKLNSPSVVAAQPWKV